MCPNLDPPGEAQQVNTRREWLLSALATVGGVAFSNGFGASLSGNLHLSSFEKQLEDLEPASGDGTEEG